jgi:hypothetical protein
MHARTSREAFPDLGCLQILSNPDAEPMSSFAPAGFDLTKTDPDVTDVLTLLDRQRRSARWVELDKVLKSLRTMARFSLRNAVGVSTTKIGRFRRGERATGIEPAPSVWKILPGDGDPSGTPGRGAM